MKDNKKNAIPDQSFLKDEEFKGIPGVKPFTKVDVMVVDANVEDVVGYAHG